MGQRPTSLPPACLRSWLGFSFAGMSAINTCDDSCCRRRMFSLVWIVYPIVSAATSHGHRRGEPGLILWGGWVRVSNCSEILDFHLFADDANLFYKHKNLKILESKGNSELVNVHTWLSANKLSLNIDKSIIHLNIWDLFRLRDNVKNLRGVNKLQVPKLVNTTRNGINSIKKVLGGYYLEQYFWDLKIPKYIVSFKNNSPPAKILANSQ